MFFLPKICSWLLNSNWSTAFHHHLAISSNAPSIIFHKSLPKWSHFETVNCGVLNRKNSIIALCKNGNIVLKNLQHVFWQSSQIRMSYYLDIGKLNLLNQKIYGPKTKFRKSLFWALLFFLNLKLKSFNSISLSFGKTIKRPLNNFSQMST